MNSIAHRHGQPMVVSIVLGSALAGGVLVLDGLLDLTVAVEAQNARALVGATFAAVVTVGAFAFWMRPIAAQLAADAVPSRVVVDRLHDSFQRRTVAVTVGVLTYEAIVLLALPTGSDTSAPTIATVLGGVLGVAAIAGLLVAMQHAERSTRPSVLVAEAARQVIERIRQAAGTTAVSPVELDASGPQAAEVVATETGWVEDIREQELLARLPAGATVRVEVDVGSFVIGNWTVVASLWAGDAEVDAASLADCFRVRDERAETLDLAGSLAQFVDIGVHAAAGSSGAPSTVFETMWHLGAILHELCRHELAIADRQIDGGGVLVFRRADASELVDLAVDRLRQVTASDPAMALELVRVVRDVRADALARDRWRIVEVLDKQSDLIVDQCRHADPLASDFERVVVASGDGRRSDEPSTRAEEYPSDQARSEDLAGEYARP